MTRQQMTGHGAEFFPDAARFAAAAAAPQIVWTRFVADMESPVAMMRKLEPHFGCSFLLESVQGGESRGRYSIFAFQPDLIWRCFKDKAETSQGGMADSDFSPCDEPSLPSLKSLLRRSRLTIPAPLPPMAAGIIGYMGYDMVKQMESLPDANPDAIGLPDACFMRPQLTLVHDAVDGVVYVATVDWAQGDAATRYAACISRLQQVLDLLAQPLAASGVVFEGSDAPLAVSSNMTPEEYRRRVEKAKDYIRAGDIFQVVPSQRFSAPFAHPPFALYRSLRHTNPSPFLFYLNFGGFALIGSSPEILVRLRDGTVTIRPIAGTRPRGATPQQDERLALDLIADGKEVSEHLMLLDLGRNDVGRVAQPHSVRVTEQMIIERYSHVMHIVSNVEGKLDTRYDAVDALMAGFPAGTVSGAPKIRAMEIIDELETERRSFYAGCVGYFSADGSMDTCITLRTALLKDGMLYAQAGGGVVVDSDPEAEYQESCNKAKAVLKAAARAHHFL